MTQKRFDAKNELNLTPQKERKQVRALSCQLSDDSLVSEFSDFDSEEKVSCQD